MLKRLVLASRNAGKTVELRALLAPLGIEIFNLSDFPYAPEPAEDADTFELNARIKALSALSAIGMAALADDSGLMVKGLDGAPGVRSARFAGDHAGDAENNSLLLEKLAGLAQPDVRRRAKFVCALALAAPGSEVRIFRGVTHGVIVEQARGANGFGYDPLFLSDDLGMTFAEAPAEAKNRISHRARALAALKEWLLDSRRSDVSQL